jgi:plastocyanin
MAMAAAATALSASTALADIFTVHVFDFDFSTNPPGFPVVDPTISVGDTIHWVWDSGLHSTTSVAGSIEVWDSGNHSPPAFFDHTFTHTGTFWYFCDIHGFDNGDGTAGGMAGTVTVVPAPASAGFILTLGAIARRRRRPQHH